MMISPNSYYEYHLKGRSRQEIMDQIRLLKSEIKRLKKSIASSSYSTLTSVSPTPMTRLKCCNEYLARALRAYEETTEK